MTNKKMDIIYPNGSEPSLDIKAQHEAVYQRSLMIRFILPCIIVLLALGALFAMYSVPNSSLRAPVAPTIRIVTPEQQLHSQEESYRRDILPLVDSTFRLNQQASTLAIQSIEHIFVQYRASVKPFVEEITSLGTRFHILRDMTRDWWKDSDDVNLYIADKFDDYFFNERELSQELEKVLLAFTENIQANQRRMLADARLAVAERKFPELIVPDYAIFEEELERRLINFGGDKGRESALHGVATLVVSAAAGSASQLAFGLVGRTAAMTASASSLGPPGAAVGLVIGVMVDYWMTDRFKDELERALITYIDSIQENLLDVNTLSENNEINLGLRTEISQFTEVLKIAHTDILHREFTRMK